MFTAIQIAGHWAYIYDVELSDHVAVAVVYVLLRQRMFLYLF